MRYKGGEHGAVDITLLFELLLLVPGLSHNRALPGLCFGGKRAYFEISSVT